MILVITWQQYLVFITVASLVYYGVMMVTCYKQELTACLKRGKTKHLKMDNTGGNKHHGKDTDAFAMAHALSDELKILVKQAAGKNYIKAELLLALQLQLAGYTESVPAAFKAAINNLIETECLKYCSIHFTGEELNQVWKK